MEQFMDLAFLVVNALKRDNMAEKFVNASASDQAIILDAYLHAEVKKFDQFVNNYMTDVEFKKQFLTVFFAGK